MEIKSWRKLDSLNLNIITPEPPRKWKTKEYMANGETFVKVDKGDVIKTALTPEMFNAKKCLELLQMSPWFYERVQNFREKWRLTGTEFTLKRVQSLQQWLYIDHYNIPVIVKPKKNRRRDMDFNLEKQIVLETEKLCSLINDDPRVEGFKKLIPGFFSVVEGIILSNEVDLKHFTYMHQLGLIPGEFLIPQEGFRYLEIPMKMGAEDLVRYIKHNSFLFGTGKKEKSNLKMPIKADDMIMLSYVLNKQNDEKIYDYLPDLISRFKKFPRKQMREYANRKIKYLEELNLKHIFD